MLTGLEKIPPLIEAGKTVTNLTDVINDSMELNQVLVNSFMKNKLDILDLFKSVQNIDKNNDGIISKDKLKDAIKIATGKIPEDLEINLIIESLDKDNNEILTIEESNYFKYLL